MNLNEMTIDVEQTVEIKADIGDVFKRVLHRIGPGFAAPDGSSLNMTLEEWAGGRWFRDRGDGIQHLWGHVQTIKPPVLIELSGPLFMSYPALNHVEFKIEQIAGGAKINFRHRAIGFIDPAHREGINTGWNLVLESIKGDFAQAGASTS